MFQNYLLLQPSILFHHLSWFGIISLTFNSQLIKKDHSSGYPNLYLTDLSQVSYLLIYNIDISLKQFILSSQYLFFLLYVDRYTTCTDEQLFHAFLPNQSKLSKMVVAHSYTSLFLACLLWPIQSYNFLSSFSKVVSADEKYHSYIKSLCTSFK